MTLVLAPLVLAAAAVGAVLRDVLPVAGFLILLLTIHVAVVGAGSQFLVKKLLAR